MSQAAFEPRTLLYTKCNQEVDLILDARYFFEYYYY